MKQSDLPPVTRRNVAFTEILLLYSRGIQEMKLMSTFIPYFFRSKYLEDISIVIDKSMSYAVIMLLLSHQQS